MTIGRLEDLSWGPRHHVSLVVCSCCFLSPCCFLVPSFYLVVVVVVVGVVTRRDEEKEI